MFGIGMPELLVILGLALVILGPKKLPDLARGLGRAMKELKRATEDMRESLHEETTELKGMKDTIVEEIDRATEPQTFGEESIESEENVETSADDVGLKTAGEETERSDEVDRTDDRKEPNQESEKAPPE
jgi:TatA/E family protein of Tat protein translocase